ncbi:hypothetical protein [Aureliella helgolandensis]|uniref:Uncharacterized protein n=1 Tax=Aureliella helgolandensis TaxID=2527968 RepID=A0A518GBV6_9BACT|nr:hypothetical protein [Aureliella helgolandensis]QDV26037.1 hypothetical protein Q31a_44070 [Aureliella helgolandensis]
MRSDSSNKDRLVLSLVNKVITPRGYRPESDEEIDAMLEGLGTEPLPKDKLERMLAKIRGDLPTVCDPSLQAEFDLSKESSEAHELAAMYRAQGKAIPPELAEKLRRMEERAAGLPEIELPEDEGKDFGEG